MEGVEIVEADVERLDEIEPLWASLSEYHGELTPDELPILPPVEGWPIRRRAYREAFADGAVLFLAERAGEVVGFAFAHPRAAPPTLAIERLLDIETVAVLPAARGGGIGGALLDALESWADAREIEHLQISVRSANDGAWRLYERRGFEPLYTTMVATRKRS